MTTTIAPLVLPLDTITEKYPPGYFIKKPGEKVREMDRGRRTAFRAIPDSSVKRAATSANAGAVQGAVCTNTRQLAVRVLDQLADNVMLHAEVNGLKTIGLSHAHTVVKDLTKIDIKGALEEESTKKRKRKETSDDAASKKSDSKKAKKSTGTKAEKRSKKKAKKEAEKKKDDEEEEEKDEDEEESLTKNSKKAEEEEKKEEEDKKADAEDDEKSQESE